MSLLPHEGVICAVNALTITDDGSKTFLFDPRLNATVCINLENGQRKILKW